MDNITVLRNVRWVLCDVRVRDSSEASNEHSLSGSLHLLPLFCAVGQERDDRVFSLSSLQALEQWEGSEMVYHPVM